MENLPDDHFVKAAQFVKTTYRDVYPAIDPSAADNSQNGKVIVITGANRGLGRRSFVPSFAKSGPKGIVIVARSVESLAAVAKEIYDINPEIKVLAVSADQTNPESVKSLWNKVKETFGHADVLINNAGVLHVGMVSEISSSTWWNDFEVNALGQFLQIQGFLELLGEENKGTIINLTSPAALQVIPTVSSYSLSKMVALQLAAFVAAENPNVTALSLNPGLILSDMTIESYKPFSKDTPELAGGLAVWLSTEKATFLNGKYVDANWSVDELVARKSEIVSEGKLSFALKGEFGSHHFEPQAYQQPPPADLVFITQTGPKKRKDQQQLIRQHVMKDIGKSRRKYKTKEKPNYPQFVLEVPESFDYLNLVASTEAPPMGEHSNKPPSSLNASEPFNGPIPEDSLQPCVRTEQKSQGERSQSNFQSDSSGPLNIERVWTGRQDPFIQYPIKVNRRTLELMDHIFDERYGNTPPFRDAWLPVGMLHPATFHQVLSNAALNLASLRSHNRVPEEKESMMHHNKALELVAKQISDHDKAVSDGVIGAIIGFACYAHVLGKHAQWHLHMKAVRNLIELRGGIETLYSNALLRMVLFWVDIGGAVTEDVQPYFPLPSRIIPPPTEVQEDMPKSLLALQISNSWRWSFPDQSEIMVIMDDIRSYSSLLQKRVIETNGAVYKEGAQAAYGILPLLSRILVLSSDPPDERQRKSDIVRLGCILYFAEIRRLFGIMGIMPSLQTHKLRLLLQKEDEDWGILEILKAWVVAFAAMESSGEERRWFLDRMRESRDRRGVSTWEEMEERLNDILWYGDIHSTMFREVVSGVEDVVYIEGATIGGSRFGGHRPLL